MSSFEQRQREIEALRLGIENLEYDKLLACEDLSEAIENLCDTPADDHTYLEMYAKQVQRRAERVAEIVAQIFHNQHEISQLA